MAGHNKWSKIKRSKGVEDAKRSALFAKIGNESIAASRACDGDLTNLRLATAISKAKASNVPKATYERAVKTGVESKNAGDNAEVVIYEGVACGGVGFLVHCLTDNRNRTAPAVRRRLPSAGLPNRSACATPSPSGKRRSAPRSKR